MAHHTVEIQTGRGEEPSSSEPKADPQDQSFTEVTPQTGRLRHIRAGRTTFEIEPRGVATNIAGIMKATINS